MTARTKTPAKYSADKIRAKLTTYGLKEAPKRLSGLAFTYRTAPHAAIVSYQERNDQRVPRRFYIDHHMFTLAE